MNLKIIAIIGLIIIQSFYNINANKLKWSYFWENLELNPTFEKLSLAEVNCNLAPNIINWIPSAIIFDSKLNFDWANKDLGKSNQN